MRLRAALRVAPDPQEAMLKLIQATREGRAVWIVVE